MPSAHAQNGDGRRAWRGRFSIHGLNQCGCLMSNRKGLLACAALAALLGGVVLAQNGPQPEGEAKKKTGSMKSGPPDAKDDGVGKKPATHKVEKGPFRIELTVKGVLEPE